MIYYAKDTTIGPTQALGPAAIVQPDRADRNEALLHAQKKTSNITFDSVEDLKMPVKSASPMIVIIKFKKTKGSLDTTVVKTDLLSRGRAHREYANKLMSKFA